MRIFFSAYRLPLLILALAIMALGLYCRFLGPSQASYANAVHALSNSDYDNAISLLGKVLQQNPNDPTTRLVLGKAYQAKEWNNEAIQQYELTIKNATDTLANAYYQLGLIAEKLGRKDEAIQKYRSALAIDSRLSGAKDHLRALMNN